jgi:hypothetical protein
MKLHYPLLICAAFLISLKRTEASSPNSSVVKGPKVAATLSHRFVKPCQPVELLITVRNAVMPIFAQPEYPEGLEMRAFRRPYQHLITGDEELWLIKYRIIPKALGDYEIPAIRVSDGSGSSLTKPLILHVSEDAKPLPPDARELSLTTDIPLSLAQEAVKTCPTPAPTPTPKPMPTSVDARPLPARVITSIGHGLTWFWNYPGK